MEKKPVLNLKTILNFVLIFLIVNFAFNYFFKQNQNEPQPSGISLSTTKKEYSKNDLVSAEIKNNTAQIATIKNRCPREPLDVLEYSNGEWNAKTKDTAISCEGTKDIIIKPNDKQVIAFTAWNHALFGEEGRYKLATVVSLTNPQPAKSTSTPSAQIAQKAGLQTIESPEFEVKPQGFVGLIWNTVFYQPLYNILIFLIHIAPGHDLGLAIILLTIIIRTILLIPSQNALRSQRKMQELQPKLNKIREKYKDNQEMIAKETMAIWKEHKANPLGSCLPLLVQFPILIALFYVIQNGLNPDNSYLLYPFLKNFSFQSINVHFFSILDLTKPNRFILPLIVGGLQFLQMKLATVRAKSSKPADDKEPAKKKKSEMDIATSSMMYVMPVMIAFFTASFPAGVGLYYSVSTLYGIVQQIVVNHHADKEKPTIRVLS